MNDDAPVDRPHAHPELELGAEAAQVAEGAAPSGREGRDLLGVGLAVYFVVLIGIVAVMLILPAVMPRT
jgi:hypothetical protein